MNLQKTQIMSPNNIHVTIDNQTFQVVDEYVYLGHNIRLGKIKQTAEANKRIVETLAAFGKLAYIFKKPKVSIILKIKVFDRCVVPATTCGMETVTFTKKSANRIRFCQGAMKLAMLGITLRYRLRNEEVRRRTKIDDIVQQIAIKKW